MNTSSIVTNYMNTSSKLLFVYIQSTWVSASNFI